jgi:hypothetical protein
MLLVKSQFSLDVDGISNKQVVFSGKVVSMAVTMKYNAFWNVTPRVLW